MVSLDNLTIFVSSIVVAVVVVVVVVATKLSKMVQKSVDNMIADRHFLH
jgi:hypothetical protein